MNFDAYLENNGISDQSAANALGVDRTTVFNIRKRRRKPSLDLAIKIERWTKGKVKVASFAGALAA